MPTAPLFRDPMFDGAADPVVTWNHTTNEWWMLYTNRRAWAPPMDDVSWVHGTDIGIAVSGDGGASWTYRGIAEGLETEPGRHTYWAPEIVDDGELFHMYLSVVPGVPTQWAGHKRTIRHYTSPDLVQWSYQSTLPIGDRVIDAGVYPLPEGGYRMWFKDEAEGSRTFTADSPDLYTWTRREGSIGEVPHEGPNVFELGGWYWMIVDEWRGQRIYRSTDLEEWIPQGLMLDVSGTRADDQGFGHHADVVVVGGEAYIFYFTHPGRVTASSPDAVYEQRRSSIQVARLIVENDTLVCDRNDEIEGGFLPTV